MAGVHVYQMGDDALLRFRHALAAGRTRGAAGAIPFLPIGSSTQLVEAAAAPLAAVDLVERSLDLQGNAQPRRDRAGGLQRSLTRARLDGVDPVAGKPFGERCRLSMPAIVDRYVEGASEQHPVEKRVSAVPDQKKRRGHRRLPQSPLMKRIVRSRAS